MQHPIIVPVLEQMIVHLVKGMIFAKKEKHKCATSSTKVLHTTPHNLGIGSKLTLVVSPSYTSREINRHPVDTCQKGCKGCTVRAADDAKILPVLPRGRQIKISGNQKMAKLKKHTKVSYLDAAPGSRR